MRALLITFVLLCIVMPVHAKRSAIGQWTLGTKSGGTGEAVNTIVAVANASRTTCWAPCWVRFDSSGTTVQGETDVWRKALNAWSFDDPTSGTWALSPIGASKNVDFGPIVGHVFASAGTYVVTLTVYEAGDSDTDTVTITVTDADTAYAGTDTICDSTSGTFTGCPTGAQQVTTSSMATVNSQIATGKRILLRKGESWTTTATTALAVADGVTGGTVDSFGTGARPVVESTASTGRVITVSGDDWRIVGIEVRAPAGLTGGSINGIERGIADHLLIDDVVVTSSYSAFNAKGGSETADANLQNEGLNSALVDCEVTQAFHNGVYMHGNRFAILGLHVVDTIDEHGVRVFWGQEGQAAHSRVEGVGSAGAVRNNFKIMCADQSGIAGVEECSGYVFYDNVVIGGFNSWMVDYGPVNDTSDERVDRGLFFGNLFLASSDGSATNSGRGLLIRGRRSAAYSNVFVATGATSWRSISVTRRGVEPAPDDHLVYNNTTFLDAASGTYYGTAVGSVTPVATNVVVTNNYVVAHGGATPSATLLENSATVGGNAATNVTSTSSAAFVDPTPGTAITDYRIDASSTAAYNKGTLPPGAWMDFDLHSTANGVQDCGASEYVP